ncbi:hypothetical protein [Sphingomonas sp. GM_Shp_1]|uniref:hypothetical protein n=1 Tax=Sphingomonas sp. GM_Shp_1 TaxID=2937381 RepID=UPI00226AFE6E|nr:hypothetical protein [Sphingomonas sp. GM_Shp_1]
MIRKPSTITLWLFRLVAAVWIATAIPIGPDSTMEGVSLWGAMAGWFYITPVILLVIGRRWNRPTAARHRANGA